MTLYHARILDTPDDPFTGAGLRADDDGGLLVVDGAIIERGSFAQLRARHPAETVVDLTDGVLLPGFVDTHVHYPQIRAIGGLGLPLLDWLEQCALPEEARLADVDYAHTIAREFVAALIDAGTTTALVFGSHFAKAVDALFEAAADIGLRITSGQVVSDRLLRHDLHTLPIIAYDEGRSLAERWHGVGRARYAVIPRFSLSCSNDLLDACASLHRDIEGSWVTTHINENPAEIIAVRELCQSPSYLDSYDRHKLVDPRTVLAHNVHPTYGELVRLAATGASVAHCPTSNAALGSGLFPLDRHLAAGVRVALGSDVGAGTGPSLFKEGLQAYFVQQLRGSDGVPLSGVHLLYLATAAGAAALELDDQIGDLSPGKRFDAMWLQPDDGGTLHRVLPHANGADDALAKIFALATPSDVASVWIDGVAIGSSRSAGQLGAA
jgi:guanine deaminase